MVFDGWFKHRANSIAQRSEDAEDILQNVAEKLLRNTNPCNQSYITKSVSSSAIDLLRAQQRRAHYESVYSEQASDFDSRSPEKLAEIAQASDAFQKAILDLSPVCQEMMLRYYIDGESQKSIAETLDVHLSTVEKQLCKGRKHCFNCVKPFI